MSFHHPEGSPDYLLVELIRQIIKGKSFTCHCFFSNLVVPNLLGHKIIVMYDFIAKFRKHCCPVELLLNSRIRADTSSEVSVLLSFTRQ